MTTVRSIAPDTDTGQVALTMACALGFGILAVFVSLANNGTVWNGLLWAGAWSAVGWFLGFLFGIPRYLSTDTARTPAAPNQASAIEELSAAIANATALRDASSQAPGDQAAADAAKQAEAAVETAKTKVAKANPSTGTSSGSSLTVNTNLEQISDWFTKIIVGVSLVESQTLLKKLREMATFLAHSMAKAGEAPNASTESFAYALMLYFLATGLLGSYLLTRLFLQRALDNAAHGQARSP